MAQTERPLQKPAWGRRGREPGRGGSPPAPLPRRTDPLAAGRAAPDAGGPPATPTARLYPAVGTPETTDGRPMPDGAGGRGAVGRPRPPPPPPQLEGHRSNPPPPPEPRGRPLSPRRDRDAGAGGCGWTCTPRAPAPPAACSRGGCGRWAGPHQRVKAARERSLGAAHGGAPEQYGSRAPVDPSHDHCPFGEGRLGVQV